MYVSVKIIFIIKNVSHSLSNLKLSNSLLFERKDDGNYIIKKNERQCQTIKPMQRRIKIPIE